MEGIEVPMSARQARVAQSPDNMPEIQRELMMIEGALTALENRQEEHISKLAPVLREDMDHPEPVLMEALPVSSEVGQALRSFHRRISNLEDHISNATYRLAL